MSAENNFQTKIEKATDLATLWFANGTYEESLQSNLRTLPDYPDGGFTKAFEREFRSVLTKESLVDLQIELFSQNLTVPELELLIEIYSNPDFQKVQLKLAAVSSRVAQYATTKLFEIASRVYGSIDLDGLDMDGE